MKTSITIAFFLLSGIIHQPPTLIIGFNKNKANIENYNAATLNEVERLLSDTTFLQIKILGYRDFNESQGLGTKRAKSLQDYFHSKGFDTSRVIIDTIDHLAPNINADKYRQIESHYILEAIKRNRIATFLITKVR